MTTDKKSIALLVDFFVKKGFRHIVISPGSRNAPVILAFTQHPGIEALSVVDERSAAFFALGIARQTGKTVALSCTSGTATLNYAPAIAEAYYQKVPLLILTADRPPEMIDQGDGQTIRQKNIYANYIKKSFELPETCSSDEELTHAQHIINEAIHHTLAPDFGPVHINLPFTEPLYGQAEDYAFKDIYKPSASWGEVPAISDLKIKSLASQWNLADKKMLVAGMMNPDVRLGVLLKRITDDPSIVLLTETTSNLQNNCSCPCIDRVVSSVLPEESESYRPELLVTFGGPVVSKMLKTFLRKNKPSAHWNIDPVDYQMNTYQCLTEGIPSTPQRFFESILPHIEKRASDYLEQWRSRDERSERRHQEFLTNTGHSDLKVFEVILNEMPDNSIVHLGNSTPVRYAQLFRTLQPLTFYANRGTSGIDGAVSTAAGSAWASQQPTIVITGDLGFLYDSNALMNHYLKGNFRIIVINNSGGGIFRFIPGPAQTQQLETYFEANHAWKTEFIARNFSVPYAHACNQQDLVDILPDFFKPRIDGKPAILEIMTPNKKNAEILKAYFHFLKV
ncbi:MAG: 2-succinyl-5-enolpyruvyl-6-hydroxy-3-cyclohexene-1-carboxylic-acid synthase [Bacteroidales bacterium]